MPLTAFLKIEDIPGESRQEGHEDEIDVHGLGWELEQTSAARVGRGRLRARADVKPITIRKFYDAASPYLAQAVRQGRSFRDMVLYVRKDSGEAHLDYLVITMENVVVSSYDLTSDTGDATASLLAETIRLDFEQVTLRYIAPSDDGSAGDEHEVEIES